MPAILVLAWATLAAACGSEEDFESARLPLEPVPAVSILAPAENVYLPLTPPATPVTLTYEVKSWSPFPAAGKEVRFFLDGQPAGSRTDGQPFQFPAVALGVHTLSAVLYLDSTPLPWAEAWASRHVRMQGPCKAKEDCEDQNPCSGPGCVSAGGGKWLCHWSLTPGCCNTLFDCPYGTQQCADITGDGVPECVECSTDAECEDGIACTVNTCVAGICVVSPKPGSCIDESGCNDGNPCTADQCDPATCACTHTPKPGCCTAAAQCDDDDPCTLDKCLAFTCRHALAGPAGTCCTTDSDCPASGWCKVGICALDPATPKGTCATVPDPAKPGCCDSDSQCANLSEKWVGTCTLDPAAGYSKCGYSLNPEWCDPKGNTLVLNEVMVDPAGVADAYGEWVEVMNATAKPIDLSGATLLSTDKCVLFPDAPHPLAPGGLLLVARTAGAEANGGLTPGFLCSTSLSLDNAGGTLQLLLAGGQTADSLTWGGELTAQEGRSLARRGPNVDSAEATSWTTGWSWYGTAGNRGTPGAQNLDAGPLPSPHKGCDDQEPCTLDVCSLDEVNFCAHLSMIACCTLPAQCDDKDPCTKDDCDPDGRCSHAPVSGCCNLAAQCDDDDPCTLDKCTNHVCHHGPTALGATCCQADEQCLGDPCTTGTCMAGVCVTQQLPDCCLANWQCKDSLACTQDLCDPATHQCSNPPLPGCCTDATQCEAVKPPDMFCRPAWCIAAACKYGPSKPGCCVKPSDCDDKNLCTLDMCDTGKHECVHEAVGPTCCAGPKDCPAGPDACTEPVCVNNQCAVAAKANCCLADSECADTNVCTLDLCLASTCRHPPSGADGCCITDAQCPADGLPCTSDKCAAKKCTHAPLIPCTLKLNYQELFDKGKSWTDLGMLPFNLGEQQGSAPPWTLAADGPLGPDGHASLPLSAGANSCLATPYLSPKAGTSHVTVGFDLDLSDNDALVSLDLMLQYVGKGGAWTKAASLNLPDPGTSHHNSGLDLDPLYATFRIAICVSTAGQQGSLAADTVALAAGHPPEFVDVPATLPVVAGKAAARTVRGRDEDTLVTGTLTFLLLDAPPWLQLKAYVKNQKTGIHQAQLLATPPAGTPAGKLPVTIRLSDGLLFDERTILVNVLKKGCAAAYDCDDANPCTADSCAAGLCKNTSLLACCGNGLVEPPEECDDGNPLGLDGCSSFCALEDNDWDGLYDYDDNCPLIANSGQQDLDADGLGDPCDLDADGDTTPNAADNCPLLANVGQADLDKDGLGDACDPDDDNDAVPDPGDNCPAAANPDQADLDKDGLGDACDPDDDNDAVPDLDDNCPALSNPAQGDMDWDGLGDACDPDADGDGYLSDVDCFDADPAVLPRWFVLRRGDDSAWRFGRQTALSDLGLFISASPLHELPRQPFRADPAALARLAIDNLDYEPLCATEALALFSATTPSPSAFVWMEEMLLPLFAPAFVPASARCSGKSAVWTEGKANASEVILWKEGQRFQLTDNLVADTAPALDGSFVAWQAAGEILLFDGAQTVPLTMDAIQDEQPALLAGRIAWTRRSGPGGTGNIVFEDLADGQLTWLTQDGVEDHDVALGAAGTAWKRHNAATGGEDVYLHDGNAIYALTTDGPDKIEQLAVGTHVVVWLSLDGKARMLKAWDGLQVVTLASHLAPGTRFSLHNDAVAVLLPEGPRELRWDCTPQEDADGDGFTGTLWGGDDCADNDPDTLPVTQVIDLTMGAVAIPSPPALHRGQVAWAASNGADTDLYLFDGKGIIRLTEDPDADAAPTIYDGDVAWQRTEPDAPSRIMLFDGATLGPVPGSELGQSPTLWGPHLTWLVPAPGGWNIVLLHRQTGESTVVNDSPLLQPAYSHSGDLIAWAAKEPDAQVHAWRISSDTLSSLGLPLLKDEDPVAFGDTLVWTSVGLTSDLYLWNGGLAVALTTGPDPHTQPALWNDNVAWIAGAGNAAEVVQLLPDGVAAPITADGTEDRQPALGPDTLAWLSGSGNAAEVMVREGASLLKLTNDAVEDRWVRTDGGQVVWVHGEDVYLYKTACGADLDKDGVPNLKDLCPTLYNPNQSDLDGDGLGDSCDPDDDNDVVLDTVDNCPFLANLDQLDLDKDGTGNACDADADNDGYLALPYGGDDCNDLDPSVFPTWSPLIVSAGSTDNQPPEIGPFGAAWTGKLGGSSQVFLYRNGILTQVTADLFDNQFPKVGDELLAWEHYDGHDKELRLFDGVSAHDLTDNAFDDRGPNLDGQTIVWYAFDGHDYEIFEFDGQSTVQVTANGKNDYHPDIDAGLLVWRGFDGNDFEVFMRKGTAVYNISDNTTDDGIPMVENGRVTWAHHDGADYEVVLWQDGQIKALSDNFVEDLDPMLDSGKVVWRRFDGHDYEVAFYTGMAVTQLTDDDWEKGPPRLSNGRVVWSAHKNQQDDWEIFTYKAGKVVQVTSNALQDVFPSVLNDTIVWKCGPDICYAQAQCGK